MHNLLSELTDARQVVGLFRSLISVLSSFTLAFTGSALQVLTFDVDSLSVQEFLSTAARSRCPKQTHVVNSDVEHSRREFGIGTSSENIRRRRGQVFLGRVRRCHHTTVSASVGQGKAVTATDRRHPAASPSQARSW
jgi:hypothetical protein